MLASSEIQILVLSGKSQERGWSRVLLKFSCKSSKTVGVSYRPARSMIVVRKRAAYAVLRGRKLALQARLAQSSSSALVDSSTSFLSMVCVTQCLAACEPRLK
jgi:hypothetical protein